MTRLAAAIAALALVPAALAYGPPRQAGTITSQALPEVSGMTAATVERGGWWVVMMVAMLLFWALVIAGVVWLIRASGRAKGAMDLLDERLATGDISIEDYERRREILAGGRSPPHA